MINLSPIPKVIQQRMFDKMKAFEEHKSYPNSDDNLGKITFDKMASRSTFIRMTSGHTNAVILMGGTLKADGSYPAGYDDVYGSRTYKAGGIRGMTEKEDDTAYFEDWDNYEFNPGTHAKNIVLPNETKRPMPGIKSIDVSFKGGVRAMREATINWTCWSFQELNQLMPHFLAHGKTVLIEWGWVYDKNTLLNLPNFLTTDMSGNKSISASAFKNYKDLVLKANGDLDIMVGIIKNFEFTTREDGAFDCQTILSSVGVGLMDNVTPNETVVDPGQSFNLNLKQNDKEVAELLTKAKNEQESKNSTDADKRDSILDINTTITLKAFLKDIDKYIKKEIETSTEEKRILISI